MPCVCQCGPHELVLCVTFWLMRSFVTSTSLKPAENSYKGSALKIASATMALIIRCMANCDVLSHESYQLGADIYG